MSEEKLIVHATPWVKRFRDDIYALKEFFEGDNFVRELKEDLSKVFSSHVAFSAHLTRTRFERETGAAPSHRQERVEKSAK